MAKPLNLRENAHDFASAEELDVTVEAVTKPSNYGHRLRVTERY